jgi:phospholipid-transporting ATPase
MTFTVPGAIFAFYISRSGGILYDGTLQAGFNMVFTSMPPFFFAIFDYDLESAPSGGHDKAYHYPTLYLSGQNGDSFNLRRFSRYAVLALAQGVVITLLGAIFNDLVAANGQTLGFYSLGLDVYGLVVLVVLMKLTQLMNTWTWLMCAIPHKPAGWALHSAHRAVPRVFEFTGLRRFSYRLFRGSSCSS